MADALAGVETGDALLPDPGARRLLRLGVLSADRRVVMVENHDDPRRVEHLVGAHLRQQRAGARGAPVVQHDGVGRDVDDFTDLDAAAIGVRCNDFGERRPARDVQWLRNRQQWVGYSHWL